MLFENDAGTDEDVIARVKKGKAEQAKAVFLMNALLEPLFEFLEFSIPPILNFSGNLQPLKIVKRYLVSCLYYFSVPALVISDGNPEVFDRYPTQSTNKNYAYFRSMIKVVLIGSGNVAMRLSEQFLTSEAVELVQVVSRNGNALKDFGSAVRTTTDFSKIYDADIYIIAISDDAIHTVSEELTNRNGLIVHTSGGTSIAVLHHHKRNGVFYPLQTFSKNREVDIKKVPFCVEANNEKDLRFLKKFAYHISEKVFEVSSAQRKSLHLAAVFVNNFTNHLYHIGGLICNENQLPFEILNPLIRETVEKLDNLSPYQAQTGPARRGDHQTCKNHLGLLKNNDEKEIYTLLSRSIQKTYGEKL